MAASQPAGRRSAQPPCPAAEGLACVQHANIVLGHSVCLTKTHIALVMELVPWTSGSDRAKTLADRLGLVGSPDPGDGALDEDTARKYFKQMTFAVDYLHACGIVHRDIKPDNILVTEKGDVKLIDLGWCRDVPAGPAPSTLVLGATAARAPEVESMRRYLPAGQQLPDDVATTPTDVWALGVCLHVMLAPSRLPFGTLCNLVEQQKLLDADNSYEPPEFVSADLVALLRSIFRVHPGPGLSPAGTPPRATARELLAQPWLAEAQPAECVLRPRPDGFDLRLATLMEQSQAPGAPLSIRFPLGAQ